MNNQQGTNQGGQKNQDRSGGQDKQNLGGKGTDQKDRDMKSKTDASSGKDTSGKDTSGKGGSCSN